MHDKNIDFFCDPRLRDVCKGCRTGQYPLTIQQIFESFGSFYDAISEEELSLLVDPYLVDVPLGELEYEVQGHH